MHWLRLSAGLMALVQQVSLSIREAMADGNLTPAEGEELGRNLSVELGDFIQLRVRGTDIVGPDAQADLCGALGRIVVRLYKATSD